MIRAQNLVKTYGDIQAVRDISFEVQEGEIFAFLGPNGAGKTTTIKMLTTLLRPTAARWRSMGSIRPRIRTKSGNGSGSFSRTPAWTTNSPPTRTWISTVLFISVPRRLRHRTHRDDC